MAYLHCLGTKVTTDATLLLGAMLRPRSNTVGDVIAVVFGATKGCMDAWSRWHPVAMLVSEDHNATGTMVSSESGLLPRAMFMSVAHYIQGLC